MLPFWKPIMMKLCLKTDVIHIISSAASGESKGHLSNYQALALFTSCKPSFMSHLLLSHLSQENNCPQLVKDLFTSYADGIEIIVASRFQETPIYTIVNGKIISEIPAITSVQAGQLHLAL
jgi:phosphoribosyl 1,2-cyclic phosphodiesterase